MTPAIAACAAVTLTIAHIFGQYEDTSLTGLIAFDVMSVLYLLIAYWFYKKGKESGGVISQKLIMLERYLVCFLVVVQWNLITYLFPTRDFWGYFTLFVLIVAFYADRKIVVIEAVGIILSITISWLIIPDKLLPVIDKNYTENLVLRAVSISVMLFSLYYLTYTFEKFKGYVDKQHKQLRRQNQALLTLNNEIIQFMANLVESRDSVTGTHIKMLEEYVRIIADKVRENCPEYKLTYDDVIMIAKASMLHDIGKIYISDNILHKKGKLSAEEFEEVKKHTEVGANLVESLPKEMDEAFRKCCKDVCLYHHERYDGNGYPKKLKGEEIPISAQIVGIADSFDALISERPYKEPYSYDRALSMIKSGECGVFSDKILNAFEESIDELRDATKGLTSTV